MNKGRGRELEKIVVEMVSFRNWQLKHKNRALKKKKEFLPVTTWMNLEDIMVREKSQSQKGKDYLMPFIKDL